MYRNTHSNTDGLSILEVSIGITIIALLIAAVFAGNNLLGAAEIRRFINEMTAVKTALTQFEDEYRALPGDLSNANSFWAGAANGNSDESIAGAERFAAWDHLVRSGFYRGSFTGAGPAALGTSIPQSTVFEIGGFGIATEIWEAGEANYPLVANIADTYQGHLIRFSAIDGGNLVNAALTPRIASLIDQRIDDGLPESGMLYGLNGADTNDRCVANGTGDNYLINTPGNACQLALWHRLLQRF